MDTQTQKKVKNVQDTGSRHRPSTGPTPDPPCVGGASVLRKRHGREAAPLL